MKHWIDWASISALLTNKHAHLKVTGIVCHGRGIEVEPVKLYIKLIARKLNTYPHKALKY